MNFRHRLVKFLGLAFFVPFVLQLPGCITGNGNYEVKDGAPSGHFNADHIPDAVPKPEARSRYGNPSVYVVGGKRYHVMNSAKGYNKVGYASWYGTKFHGQHTSSREPYDMFSMTAASTTLPIPTYVRVTNLENGRSVVVKVNDRGPFKSSRIIDLSYAAAKKLGYTAKGTAKVRVTAIETGTGSHHEILLASNSNKGTTSKRTASASRHAKSAKTIQLAAADTSSVKSLNKSSSKTSNKSENKPTNKNTKNENKPLYLQVGAFKTREKAEDLSKQISGITAAAVSVKKTMQDQKTIYRVHIGPLANGTQTAKIKELLAQHGFEKPIAVAG